MQPNDWAGVAWEGGGQVECRADRRRSHNRFICDPSVSRSTEGRRAAAGRALILHPGSRRNVSEETADPRLTEGETAGVEENIFAEGREGATVFRLSAI